MWTLVAEAGCCSHRNLFGSGAVYFILTWVCVLLPQRSCIGLGEGALCYLIICWTTVYHCDAAAHFASVAVCLEPLSEQAAAAQAQWLCTVSTAHSVQSYYWTRFDNYDVTMSIRHYNYESNYWVCSYQSYCKLKSWHLDSVKNLCNNPFVWLHYCKCTVYNLS